MTTRTTAMRVRMDLAKPTNPADMKSLAETAEAIQALKSHAASLGFELTSEVNAKLGSYVFEDGQPEEQLADPAAEGI